MESVNPEENCTRPEENHVYILHSPCYLLKEAVKAIMKCFGFDDHSSSPAHHDKKEDHQPSATPPDPPADPPPPGALARRGRTPPRPVVSGGRDPQTHSVSSS